MRCLQPVRDGRRPDERSYESVISYLEASLDRVALDKPDPGRSETFHRLNRAQYRNAIRDLLALDVDVSAMLPTDDASHGFDNVNVSGLSPTLVEQYLSRPARSRALRSGCRLVQPDARTVVLPLDYTQDYHVEGLPYGTRGGTLFEHNFPVDGEYEFQIRLSRNRDEQIEGFNETLNIELALDGERLQLFSLTPNRPERGAGPAQQYMTDESDVDAGLKGRFPVKAGPHTVTAAFLKKPGLPETARQPFKADYNGRSLAAIFSVSVAGPYDAGGARADAEPPARFRMPAVEAFGGARLCEDDHRDAGATRLQTPARRCGPGETAQVLSRRTCGGRHIRAWHRDGAAGDSGEPGFPVPHRARSRACRRRDARISSAMSNWRRVSRSSSGAAFRTNSCSTWRLRGKLRNPRILEQQVRRMLADERSEALVDNFAEQWLYLRNLAAVTPDPTVVSGL